MAYQKTSLSLEHILHDGVSVYNSRINQSTTEGVVSLVLRATESGDKVWDLGVGRGEIFQELQSNNIDVYGIDFNLHPKFQGSDCVFEKSIEDWLEEENKTDIVIMSHVLEHLASPYDIMRRIAEKRPKNIIVAVPNPLYLPIVIKSLFVTRRAYVNDGHLWSWDFHHLKNFFRLSTGGYVVDWEKDAVTLPLPGQFREILYSVGITRFIEFWLLPRILPMFSRSIIVSVDLRKLNEND